jgi:hypothetical protein
MWRIYYANESIYSSEDGGPETAPARGVIAILQPNEDQRGWHVLQQTDYYLWRDDWGGTWQGADRQGRDFYLHDPGWKRVLFGESVPNSIYERITQRALAERRIRNNQ